MMEINQILPTLSPGDAIGNEAVEIRELLRKWGYESDIYAQNIHPEMEARNYIEYGSRSSSDNILIFHFSIGSDVSHFVKTLPDKKIIVYHNVTPPDYFYGINDYLAKLLTSARHELASYSGITELALGDSEYNRVELQQIGFTKTDILPIILNFENYDKYDYSLLQNFHDDYINILFVGRITPNKKQEDIIKIFHYYKYINPRSRLFLVGNYEGLEKYYNKLYSLIDKLNLKDVHITGRINLSSLISYYKLADVFICMSEHEGFCVPLLECMYFDIPIIAYNSTAIPYTLGDAGILVNKKNYREVAEMIDIIVNDTQLRGKIIEKQRERLSYFDRDKIAEKFKRIIEDIVS